MRRKELLEKAREAVKQAYVGRDRMLIQNVNSVNDLNKVSNLLFERLREWYEMYFPEFSLADQEKYCRAVELLDKEFMDRKEDIKELESLLGKERARELLNRMKNSLGIDLQAKDVDEIQLLAKTVRRLFEAKRKLVEYQTSLAIEICPNLSHLLGPELAARMVAQAGGLEKLALLPASTVQVLGAEKALFKHLRKKSKPPKHGIIFQHPLVGMSPKHQRGKIARALAAKIAIAAKADAFTKRFIAEKLKTDFEERVKRVKGG